MGEGHFSSLQDLMVRLVGKCMFTMISGKCVGDNRWASERSDENKHRTIANLFYRKSHGLSSLEYW